MMILDEDFSEFYGILMGDGCLSQYVSGGRTRRVIRIDGHGTDDLDYYKNILLPLIKKICNKDVKIKRRKDCNGIFVYFECLELFDFLKDNLKFPVGKKGNIKINEKIVKNWNLLNRTLCGLADTDGCFYFVKNNTIKHYPVIELSSHSTPLLIQLKNILLDKGFRVYITHNKDSLRMNGKKYVSKWVKQIGFNNPTKICKYLYWKKLAL